MLFQPVNRLCIQVVGRLVEKQYIRLLQQQTAQCHTSALTSREVLHHSILVRATQCIHRTLQFRVDIPSIMRIQEFLHLCLSCQQFIKVSIWVAKRLIYLLKFSQLIHNWLHTFLHNLFHSLIFVEFRLLFEITHRVSWREYHLTLIRFFDTRNNLHQR